MANVTNITFEAGHIVVYRDSGPPTIYDIADMLRAVDIPTGLTYAQVGAVTTLANLIVVLIRTLIDRQVLDDSFLEDGGYNLDAIVESIENMGGAYENPDITGNI